jgi:hypothetical protein
MVVFRCLNDLGDYFFHPPVRAHKRLEFVSASHALSREFCHVSDHKLTGFVIAPRLVGMSAHCRAR